jgi:hypothetical protein
VVERIQRSPSGKPDYPWAKRIAEAAATGDSASRENGNDEERQHADTAL